MGQFSIIKMKEESKREVEHLNPDLTIFHTLLYNFKLETNKKTDIVTEISINYTLI